MNVSTRNRIFAVGAITVAIAAGTAFAQTTTPTPATPAPGAMPGPMTGHGQMGHGPMGHGMHGGRGDGMMMRFDTDRDGKLSRAEFEAGHRAMAERSLKAFDAADTDRDGTLTAEERRAFREAMHAQRSGADGMHRREMRNRPLQPGAPAAPITPGA